MRNSGIEPTTLKLLPGPLLTLEGGACTTYLHCAIADFVDKLTKKEESKQLTAISSFNLMLIVRSSLVVLLQTNQE